VSQRDLEGFAIAALICWLTSQPCPRSFEYRFEANDGLPKKRKRLVYRKITFF